MRYSLGPQPLRVGTQRETCSSVARSAALDSVLGKSLFPGTIFHRKAQACHSLGLNFRFLRAIPGITGTIRCCAPPKHLHSTSYSPKSDLLFFSLLGGHSRQNNDTSPQRCPCPNPGTCEYVTLCGNRDFTSGIKSRTLRREIALRHPGVPKAITSVLVRGRQEGQG